MGKKKLSTDPRVVATHKALLSDVKPWYEALDEAVERQFPDLISNTYLTTKGYNTAVKFRHGDQKVTPKLHRALSNFIAGFMACERSYQ